MRKRKLPKPKPPQVDPLAVLRVRIEAIEKRNVGHDAYLRALAAWQDAKRLAGEAEHRYNKALDTWLESYRAQNLITWEYLDPQPPTTAGSAPFTATANINLRKAI